MSVSALRTRLLAATSLLGGTLLVVLAATTAAPTEAQWYDSEFGSGAFTAKTIAKPIYDSCVMDGGLLGATPLVTIKWHFPVGNGYVTPTNINYYVSAGTTPTATPTLANGNAALTTTGPVGGVYTTTIAAGLLSGILGGGAVVYLQSKESSGWTSTFAEATARLGLLGANPSCTIAAP